MAFNLFDSIGKNFSLQGVQRGAQALENKFQLGNKAFDYANSPTQNEDLIQKFLDDSSIDQNKKVGMMKDLSSGVPKEAISSYLGEKYYPESSVQFRETLPYATTLFPRTGQDGPAKTALKTFGNALGSTYNVVAGGVNLASTTLQEGPLDTADLITKAGIQGLGQGAQAVSEGYNQGGVLGGTNVALEGVNKYLSENPADVFAPKFIKPLGRLAKNTGKTIVKGVQAIPQNIVEAGRAVINAPQVIVRSGINTLEKIKPGIKDNLADIDPQSRYAVERATPERVGSIIEDAKQAKMNPDADYQQTPYHKGAEMGNKTADMIEENLRKRQDERMAILENVPLEKVNLESVRSSLRAELDKLNIEDVTIDDTGKPVVVSKKGRSALLDSKNSQDMQAIEKLREILKDDVSPLQTMDNIKILQEWLYENKGTIALKGISKKMEGIVSKVQGSLNKTFKDQLPPEYKKVMESMSEDIGMSNDIKRLFGIDDNGNQVGNRGELIMKRLTNGTTTGGEARVLAEKIFKKYGVDLIQEARLRQLSMELVGDTRGANLFGVLLSGKRGMMDWAMGKVGEVLINKENLIKSYAGKGPILKPKKQPTLYTNPKKNGTPIRNSENNTTDTNTRPANEKVVTPKPLIVPKKSTPIVKKSSERGVPKSIVKEGGVKTWEELNKNNPDLFEKGILRRSQSPMGVSKEDFIPKNVHKTQHTWQHYGQYDEFPASKIYDKKMHKYIDENGKYIEDSQGNILEDVWNDATQEWTDATIKNSDIRNNLLEIFKTQEGANYLKKVISALPKDKDGYITAYRIGDIRGDGVQSYTLSEGMAKTFSNVGTDIIPSMGMKSGGYKEFGKLPHSIVKIDPKGIEAWSPYDAEILVSPKYVTIKNKSIIKPKK